MPPQPEDSLGALEKARERLYSPDSAVETRPVREVTERRILPHAWKEAILPSTLVGPKRHIRLATIFFTAAAIFFVLSLSATLLIFYLGGNSVSVDKIAMSVEGPTSIASGDETPLTLTVTNKNAVAIKNATIDITFPSGTRNASNVLSPYPRYSENFGTLASGQTITRTIKTVMFGEAGQTLTLPVALSYTATDSSATFVKKSSYPLVVSTTPLTVSVEARTEAVSGQSFPITLTVTSNARVPLTNVVLTSALPFGYTVTSSSVPLNNSSFLLGTLQPGVAKKIMLTGTLTGQESDQRVFHFTLGTASSAQDQILAVTYTTLDVPVTMTSPFLNTLLSINGDSGANVILTPGALQNVSLSYANTLTTSITNATVGVTITGSAIDYNSIQTSNGFYRSSDHTILFSRDTDPSLAQLSPGATGVGTFTFATLPLGSIKSSPTVGFSISVSGTRVGQTNVPEQLTASATKFAKVATSISFTAGALHTFGSLVSSGPNPPKAGETSTYAIVWNVRNSGSAVAGGTVTATLPSYVSYTNNSTGSGNFSYDPGSRTMTWTTGDLGQGASVQGAFQVSFNPSNSQKGTSPQLTSRAAYAGFDRFAGVQVTASAEAVTTETRGDSGYSSTWAIVQ
ncbi:MAG: hypothetical protein JWN18_517 [Parcubacteria group bacterium]|nr:hypothetical protein [Parcubacteria group bacterium]